MSNYNELTAEISVPQTITEDSENQATSVGHSHKIEKATQNTAGIVKVVDHTESADPLEALSANQGRILAETLREVVHYNKDETINQSLDAALGYLSNRLTASYSTLALAEANAYKHAEASLIYVVNDVEVSNCGLYTIQGGQLVKAPWDALSSALTSEPFEVLQSIMTLPADATVEYQGNVYFSLATLGKAIADGQTEISEIIQTLANANGLLSRYILTDSGKTQEEVNTEHTTGLGDAVNELSLKAPQATTYTKVEVDTKIGTETTRATTAETLLQTQINTNGVGNRAYKTYVDMAADAANIPAKSKVTVTNDSDPAKNGDWQWDGATFTKSSYDSLTQSKDYTDSKVAYLKSITAYTVATEANRASIPLSQRVEGMYVDVIETGKLWQWLGGSWTDTGLSELDQATHYTDTELNQLTRNLFINPHVITDKDSNKFIFSVLNTALNKLLFGITDKSELNIGDVFLKEESGQWSIQDSSGRSFLRYKDECLYFMNYKIAFKGNGITVLDSSGKALFRLSKKGTLYASKYQGIPEQQLVSSYVDYQLADSGQFKETDVTHELVYGQSLSVSTTVAIPLQSLTQLNNNIMFAGGVRLRIGDVGFVSDSFSALVEEIKETPCSGICNGLSQRFVNTYSNRGAVTPSYLGTTTGEGGKDILYLSPTEDGGNTSPSRFNDTIKIVEYAKRNCDALNKTYAVGSYYWVQGENDGAIPMYLYDTRLRNLKQRFDEKILKITGQRYRPNMVIAQTAGHRRYNRSFFGACLSQLRMSNLYEDMVLAVPIYQLPHSNDFLHLNGFGAWLLGQYLAKASFYTRYMGQKWKPLQPSWVKWNDTEIIVGGWNPHGTTLVIDNALCATTENAGFDLFSPSDTLLNIISNVELLDSTTIKITLSSPAPADARLCCGRGRDYMNGTTRGGPQTGARTNIRDDHGEFDQVVNPLDSSIYKMHNASVMWQYDRQNGFNSI